MKSSRVSLLVVFLVTGLLVALPGIAEGVERMIPGDDCTDDCPADSADGKCGTSCDECTCCARTMIAVFKPYPSVGAPGQLDTASSSIPARVRLILTQGVYHPPRA